MGWRPRPSGRRHSGRGSAAVAHDLRADLDQLLLQTRQRPVLDRLRRRQRAQRFLKDVLAPKRVTEVEEQAAKAHIDDQAFTAARTDLGIVASRSNAGGVQAVQWSLPG